MNPGKMYEYHEKLGDVTNAELKRRYYKNMLNGDETKAVLCLIEADYRGLYIAEAPLPPDKKCNLDCGCQKRFHSADGPEY